MKREYVEIKIDKKDIEKVIEDKVEKYMQENMLNSTINLKLKQFKTMLRDEMRKYINKKFRKQKQVT